MLCRSSRSLRQMRSCRFDGVDTNSGEDKDGNVCKIEYSVTDPMYFENLYKRREIHEKAVYFTAHEGQIQ